MELQPNSQAQTDEAICDKFWLWNLQRPHHARALFWAAWRRSLNTSKTNSNATAKAMYKYIFENI